MQPPQKYKENFDVSSEGPFGFVGKLINFPRRLNFLQRAFDRRNVKENI
jgi:hypothetical protein